MFASLIGSSVAKRLLIADDDPGLLRFLADRCTRLGFEVETVTNGLQAIVVAGRFRPDVLILDINMPEIDGLSVAARLLAPGRRPLEVIIITASSFVDTQQRCRAFGAVHVRKGAGLMEEVGAALLDLFPVLKRADQAAFSAGPDAWTLPRLLIVDDDPAMGELLSSRLLKRGIRTVLARDSVQGHCSAIRHEPSLVMVKHPMRNGDAHYLLQRLRCTAKTERVPVIVFGREIEDAERARLMRYEMGRACLLTFLQTPILIESLFAEIQKTCAFSIESNAFLPLPAAAVAAS